jgi:type I restriction enzyme M protein
MPSKKAKELFEEVELRFLARLTKDLLPENLGDLQITVRYLELSEKQANLKTHIKDAEVALDKLAYEKYPQLTETEIKTLVVDDKWLTTLAVAVQGELDRVSQTLTGRIRQLAERYATPLPKLVEEVDVLAARVEEHLKKMGAVWN